MFLGVVSDTHGNLQSAQAAARMLQTFDVEAVLHCGDIGTLDIMAAFSPWPGHYVLGNCDDDSTVWNAAASSHNAVFHGRFADLELGERRIAVIHSDDARRFRDVIASQAYDLVCYGHSHRAEQHREGKTLVLNPGALYRANPYTIAVVDLGTMQVEHIRV